MSLLQQINERNAAQSQEAQQAQQAEQDEAGKPDAVQQARDKRSQYGSMMANTPDEPNMQDEQASPEEQEEFTRLELEVAEIVNGQQANQLIKLIQAAGDPVEGIGQAAHDIIKLIEGKNKDIDSEILFAVGESAVEQVVQLYEEVDPASNLNEDQLAEAFSIGLQEWMGSNPNKLDPDLKEYMASAAPPQL